MNPGFGVPTTSFGNATPFGSSSPPNSNSTVFGSAGTTTSFGKAAAPSQSMQPPLPPNPNVSPFGQTKTAFGSSSIVGSSNSTSGSTPFGSKPKSPLFGSPSAAKSKGFGSSSGFGGPSTFKSSAQPFGSTSSGFGTSATTFGTTKKSTQPAFGQSTTGFGDKTTFGSTKSTGSGFGSTAEAKSSVFGTSAPAQPAFGSTFGKPAQPAFGGAAISPPFGSSRKTIESKSVLGDRSDTKTTFGKSPDASNRSKKVVTAFGGMEKKRRSPSPVRKKRTNNNVKVPSNIPEEDRDAYLTAIGSSDRSFVGGKGSNKSPVLSQKKKVNIPSNIPAEDHEAYLAAIGSTESSFKKKKPAASPVLSPVGSDDDDMGTSLDGVCIDMCSMKERGFRTEHDELSAFEKPLDQENVEIIKRFQRSSADHKLNIPSEVRPPGVLRQTLYYLEQNLMDRDQFGIDSRLNPPRVPDLIDLYNFCWDRTRMIRKDFILQNYRSNGRVHPIVMDVHERIARYHILSEHELCDEPNFVAQQNMEQLGQTLKSLNEYYDECGKSPVESEFRAYFILCTLDNTGGMDVLQYILSLPKHLRDTDQVQFAIQVFRARKLNDFQAFFKLFQKATYLQACLMHRYLPNAREMTLNAMNRAYKMFPIQALAKRLMCDSLEQAVELCELHGLQMEQDMVKFRNANFEMKQMKNKSKSNVITEKRNGFTRGEICRGRTEYLTQMPSIPFEIIEFEKEERQRLYPDRPVIKAEQHSAPPPQAPVVPVVVKKAAPTPNEAELQQQRARALSEELGQRKKDVLKEKEELENKLKLLEDQKEAERLEQLLKHQKREREEKKRQEEILRAQEKEKEEKREKQRLMEEAKQRELQEKHRLLEAERKREAERRQQEELERLAREKEQERQKQERLDAEQRRLEAERQRQLLEKQRQAEAERRRILEEQQAKLKRKEHKMRLARLKLKFHTWLGVTNVLRDLKRNKSIEPVMESFSSMNLALKCQPVSERMNHLFRGSGARPVFADSNLSTRLLRSFEQKQQERFKRFWAPLRLERLVGYVLAPRKFWTVVIVSFNQSDSDLALAEWIKWKLQCPRIVFSNDQVSICCRFHVFNGSTEAFQGADTIFVSSYQTESLKMESCVSKLKSVLDRSDLLEANVHFFLVESPNVCISMPNATVTESSTMDHGELHQLEIGLTKSLVESAVNAPDPIASRFDFVCVDVHELISETLFRFNNSIECLTILQNYLCKTERIALSYPAKELTRTRLVTASRQRLQELDANFKDLDQDMQVFIDPEYLERHEQAYEKARQMASEEYENLISVAAKEVRTVSKRSAPDAISDEASAVYKKLKYQLTQERERINSFSAYLASELSLN